MGICRSLFLITPPCNVDTCVFGWSEVEWSGVICDEPIRICRSFSNMHRSILHRNDFLPRALTGVLVGGEWTRSNSVMSCSSASAAAAAVRLREDFFPVFSDFLRFFLRLGAFSSAAKPTCLGSDRDDFFRFVDDRDFFRDALFADLDFDVLDEESEDDWRGEEGLLEDREEELEEDDDDNEDEEEEEEEAVAVLEPFPFVRPPPSLFL